MTTQDSIIIHDPDSTGAQELTDGILPVNKICDLQTYLVKSEISLQAGKPGKKGGLPT